MTGSIPALALESVNPEFHSVPTFRYERSWSSRTRGGGSGVGCGGTGGVDKSSVLDAIEKDK